ncbi:hypothetical protein LCGC14_2534910 [marine sediment metagenome]|uniref:Uncharacterized protein n=1 Tax=marine sediment metagenome TaxID=412755 RepID=A0A0F9D3X2_9ZZZZ
MTPMTSDRQERARVRSRIGSLIMEFCYYNQGFYMEDLRRFVERRLDGAIAPDSPGRILRQLRQQKLLNYKIVSRRQSLYRVVPVERPAEQAELFYERVG